MKNRNLRLPIEDVEIQGITIKSEVSRFELHKDSVDVIILAIRSDTGGNKVFKVNLPINPNTNELIGDILKSIMFVPGENFEQTWRNPTFKFNKDNEEFIVKNS